MSRLILTDDQFVALLTRLEEGDKSFTQASYRDLMMTSHTDMFFELGFLFLKGLLYIL